MYRQGEEDRMIRTIERKRNYLLLRTISPKPNVFEYTIPTGRAKHVIKQIADLEMYLGGMKKVWTRRSGDTYLFDKTELLRIDSEKKAQKQIRVAG